eukprot:scaffold827_cov369-Prasinococcus_capsulatus_cf.AAC.26
MAPPFPTYAACAVPRPPALAAVERRAVTRSARGAGCAMAGLAEVPRLSGSHVRVRRQGALVPGARAEHGPSGDLPGLHHSVARLPPGSGARAARGVPPGGAGARGQGRAGRPGEAGVRLAVLLEHGRSGLWRRRARYVADLAWATCPVHL